ncbi:hypothetical protein BBJ28_00011649 [Nothophytophthora sp. Chile5]|nr:hypothetical protein BBJ28_00011649 [Nothophytophthora sp. Chile5]
MWRARRALLLAAVLLPLATAGSVTTLLFRAARTPRVSRNLEEYASASTSSDDAEGESVDTTVLRYASIVLLVVMSAISSGLTLGLMSLDKVGLDVVIRAGARAEATADEHAKARAAKRILPIRADSNLLLTTLVLTTVAVNSLLSILMADLTSGLVGFFVSTGVIVLFGEVIPQSLCSRHALIIGSAFVPFVRVLRLALYVFAKPVSFVLDRTVGEDMGTIFSKRELQKLLEIHVTQQIMHPEEGHIVRGAMGYKLKLVSDIMMPASGLFSLPISFFTSNCTLKMIYNSGFSRVPVWNKDPNDVVGIIFVKDLIYVDPKAEVPLLAFARVFAVAAHRIWLDAVLGEVLSVFKMGSTHMALVYDVNNSGPGDPFYQLKGLVTLEDIMEEILQSKIVDETDSPEARKERQNCTDQIGLDGGEFELAALGVDSPVASASPSPIGPCRTHAAAAFIDRIWIVGGVSASYYTKRLEYTASRSDVVSSPDGIEWTEVLEEAPFRRRFGHSLLTFTDASDGVQRLTLVGGFSPEPATDIWVTTDGASWSETTATTPWTGRGYHCSVEFDSRLWVLGGSPMNNEVWSTSSVLTGNWEQQSDVPWTPRAAHACTAHEIVTNVTEGDSSRETFLFLMGGWRETSLRDVWRMDSSRNWELMLEVAPWEARAWLSLVSFDSRTAGDVQLGPRLWVLGGGIVGNGIEKMYPFSDVWYTRDGVDWVAASSNASGISTAEWSMLSQSNTEVCMGKWGHTVVPFHRKVSRAYYCHESCANEAGTMSLANQLIPVCDPTTTLPDVPVQHTVLRGDAMITMTLYPDGCGLCMTGSSARFENGTTVPTLFLLAGNVGTQKVNDVFQSSNGSACQTLMYLSLYCIEHYATDLSLSLSLSLLFHPVLCEKDGEICSSQGTKRMADVDIGDAVLALDAAGKPTFAPVYYIPHDSIRDVATAFIRVEHEGSQDLLEPLELTPDHLVFHLPEGESLECHVAGSDATTLAMPKLAQKPARELRVNDRLVLLSPLPSSRPSGQFNNTESVEDASPPTNSTLTDRICEVAPARLEEDALQWRLSIVKVMRLSRVARHGAVTLYTTTGNFFVAGVLCSNFGDYYPTLTGQRRRDRVAFELFAPHRLVFALLPYSRTAELLRVLMNQLVLPTLRWLLPRLFKQS